MVFKIPLAGCMMLPILTIFAEEVQWPPPPNGYASASSSIPKGTVSNVINYPTRNYGNRQCRIYMPPSYSKTRVEKYPVLYLHHGIGGNQDAWTSQNGQAEGNADKVMDFLYAQANLKVTPMLVVMPMGNMTNTSGDTWQNFEDVLINDLAPYVESNYNGSSDPNLRAIAGLSMGGGQTLNFGYKNPAVFTWIGAFSPAPNTIDAGTTIKDIAAVKANVHLNLLAAGTGGGTEPQCLSTARTYHTYLNKNNVSNLYLQVEQGVGHERENWNRQLHNFAQRIFKGTTGIRPTGSAHMVISGNHKTILSGNGLCLTPWSMFMVRSRAAFTKPNLFTLDGRAINPLRRETSYFQPIGHDK
jgi:enterochelin esterase-like enzyme